MFPRIDMAKFSESFGRFRQGLSRRLLWEYWLTFKEHGWETFWGATLLGVPFGIYTLYRSPSAVVFLSYLLCVVFLTGYSLWRADHVRLQQKIEARVRKHSWSIETGGQGWQYFLELVNKSEAITLRGIQVQLQEIDPDNQDWFPVTLHQQHDNPRQDGTFAERFDLNPLVPKNIDLFSAATGGSGFQISHIVAHTLIFSFSSKHRLHVTISGQDIKPISVWLDVWMSEERMPQCEIVSS
jgi:hypothetical protein